MRKRSVGGGIKTCLTAKPTIITVTRFDGRSMVRDADVTILYQN
jgi:hypothetical protein